MPEIEKSQIVNWETEMLRFTAFHTGIQDIPNWWEELFLVEPDTTTFQSKIGMKHYDGIIHNEKYTLNLSPNRIDWQISKQDDNPVSVVSTNTIGQFIETSSKFLELINKWLNFDSIPVFKRIAFAGSLILPVESRIIGYEKMNGLLTKVELNPENMSDFYYQINIPKKSETKIPELIINRLTKWSVPTTIFMPVSPTSFGDVPNIEESVCKLEFDMNTSPNFHGEIPKEQTICLLSELYKFAFDVSQKGIDNDNL